MVLRGAFPHDIRVEKEARSLLAGGHEVSLCCLAREDADEPLQEDVDGVDVRRVPRVERYSLPYRTAKTARFLLTLTDVVWRRELDAFVRETGVDALHVHDLPLVRTAQSVADDHDLPLVADLHENYPEAARQWRTGMGLPRRAVQEVFTPYRRLRRLERDCVRHADHVLATTPEGRTHYVEDCDADPDRVTVVSNTVDLRTYDTDADPVEGYDDEFVVGYVGSFGPHRGLESLVDAMPALVERVPNARLLLVGGAGDAAYDRSLRERAAATGVDERITFTGWVDASEVPRYVATCDVCAVPHARNPHTETTVPHKLFQYMASRKPVLVSDVAPLARVVTDADCGVVVPAGDGEAVAARLTDLAGDAARRARLGTNGRAAVEKTYNWEREGGQLDRVYRRLAGRDEERTPSTRRRTRRA
ncbi:glycosyltransferase family 4 protein [Halomarina salina]|uniref:Glycosyltransferase family 4 protein n=2 Tax=Halomarina salina TaxID=1872699 RepID=A0ABD5RUR6_9EURY